MPDLMSAFLQDVLTHTPDAYVVGTPDARLQALLDERRITAHSVHDATEQLPLVIATDGPLEQPATQHCSWNEALVQLAARLAPGGTLVLGVRGSSTLADLLTAVPSRVAPAPGSPASAVQLRDALRRAGLRGATVHLLFGDQDSPSAILTERAAAGAGPGTLPALFVESAYTAEQPRVHSLLDPADAIDRAARAGALSIAATGFIAVVGGKGRDLYASDGDGVTWAEYDDPAARWVMSDRIVHAGANVEEDLRAAAAAADLTLFGRIAADLGSFVRTDPTAGTSDGIHLQHLARASDGRISWLLLPRATTSRVDPDDLLSGAWSEFLHRLGHRRDALPWPALRDDAELVRHWAGLSGAQGSLTAAGDDARSTESSSVQEDMVARARFADRAELLRERLAITQDVLHQRENQLTVRETSIRQLRDQLVEAQQAQLDAERETAAIRRSPGFRLANRATLLRDPKKLILTVGNRLDKQVKQIRRMR